MQRRKGSPKVIFQKSFLDGTARITAIAKAFKYVNRRRQRVLNFYRLSTINKVVLALLAGVPGNRPYFTVTLLYVHVHIYL